MTLSLRTSREDLQCQGRGSVNTLASASSGEKEQPDGQHCNRVAGLPVMGRGVGRWCLMAENGTVSGISVQPIGTESLLDDLASELF